MVEGLHAQRVANGWTAPTTDQTLERQAGVMERLADVERCDNTCRHPRTKRGKDSPLRYGSYRTEVCRDCAAFCTHGHDEARSNMSAWRPDSEYADARDAAALPVPTLGLARRARDRPPFDPE